MFRATLHTSFIDNNMLRLILQDLDVTPGIEMVVPEDFFIDLIFTDSRNLKANQLLKTSPALNPTTGETLGGPKVRESQLEQKLSKIQDFEEEKLMQGVANAENKDDFWISISNEI